MVINTYNSSTPEVKNRRNMSFRTACGTVRPYLTTNSNAEK